MNTGHTREKKLADKYSLNKVPLAKFGQLRKFTERSEIQALKLADFRQLGRAVRNDPETEYYLLSEGSEMQVLIFLRQSLFIKQSYFEILKLGEGEASTDLTRAILEAIYKLSLKEAVITSTVQLSDESLRALEFSSKSTYLYHCYKENINPEANRIFKKADKYIVLRFNRRADALIGVFLLSEGQSCPEFLQAIFEAQGLLTEEGILKKLDNYLDPRPTLSPLQEEAERQITEYLEGKRQDFTLAYVLPQDAGEFQVKVWQELAKIPYGTYCTYEEIARRIVGSEVANKYGRAVGAACSANPLMLILPCHRVLGKGGELRGFMTGVETKAWLLDHELLRYR